MFHSQNFLAQERHLHKSHPPDSDGYFRALREALGRHLSQFSDEMVSDTFDFAIARGTDTAEAIQLMADIIDLLWMQYDDQNDPFVIQDWEYVRELINENATELDMDLVQYVMERVVDHGAI
ncbi:MAG: hypothetical protein WCY01_03285 [Alkalispirochaeta sp.]